MPDIYIHLGWSILSANANYYKIIKFLGQGGNAFAYKVLCTSGKNHGLTFVLKLQYNISNEMRLTRFRRESSFLKDETHPAILRHFDDGIYALPNKKEYPFIVTNYLPETLRTRIQAGNLDFSQKVQYSCQLLSAISYLQSKQIIHRDIKPNNIFINNNDVVLGDFGLIKKLGEEGLCNDDDIELMKDTIMFNGTTENALDGYVAMARYYRTPELVAYARKEAPLRIESDIFQLGLVLAELFTGENPLLPSVDLTSPINMKPIGYVFGNDALGGKVFKVLVSMLTINYQERPSVKKLLEKFTGLYEQLEGFG